MNCCCIVYFIPRFINLIAFPEITINSVPVKRVFWNENIVTGILIEEKMCFNLWLRDTYKCILLLEQILTIIYELFLFLNNFK